MSDIKRHIYTVSELNAEIKNLLETAYPFVWISAEVSNFRMPSSGHVYFSLKDATSQISAVMFRSQNRNLKFQLEDGMSVTGFGRVSVYEPRGAYQLILEYLEPKGIGALQMAFEQLKEKLAAEGLFDDKYKKPIPFLPNRLVLITSSSGAVVHDIIHVAGRRFPNLDIRILPVKVQGSGAEDDIEAAIDSLNRHKLGDVAILARGGGSLEDLQAYNSEQVALAIFASQIPIISAVGHETDYTIADFVADLRAPTPSAAAELAVPLKIDLYKNIQQYQYNLLYFLNNNLKQKRVHLSDLSKRLTDPRRRVQDARLKLDDLSNRLDRSASSHIHRAAERLNWRISHLQAHNPILRFRQVRQNLMNLHRSLRTLADVRLVRERANLRELSAKLDGYNPESILARGYSITRTLPDRQIVRSSDSVNIGQNVETVLAEGIVESRIKRIIQNGQKKADLRTGDGKT